jgi:ribosomal RNA-processing protein 12
MGEYLEAMHGEDGHTRTANGAIKFNKTQGKRARGNDDDEGDFSVTEGLKELEVAGKRKKAKKETVRVGAEFKAKVRHSFLHSV